MPLAPEFTPSWIREPISRLNFSTAFGNWSAEKALPGLLKRDLCFSAYSPRTNPSSVFSACWWRSGGAPYRTRADFPERLNKNMVGTDVMSPKAAAVDALAIAHRRSGLRDFAVARIPSSGDSTASATTATLSPYFCFSSPSHCNVDRQGGHHVAQNSTKTTRPAN